MHAQYKWTNSCIYEGERVPHPRPYLHIPQWSEELLMPSWFSYPVDRKLSSHLLYACLTVLWPSWQHSIRFFWCEKNVTVNRSLTLPALQLTRMCLRRLFPNCETGESLTRLLWAKTFSQPNKQWTGSGSKYSTVSTRQITNSGSETAHSGIKGAFTEQETHNDVNTRQSNPRKALLFLLRQGTAQRTHSEPAEKFLDSLIPPSPKHQLFSFASGCVFIQREISWTRHETYHHFLHFSTKPVN